ncbi:MAG: 3-deoxy-D-manno-octulosonic acid transferase [Fusobacteriaceae bacterium]
MNLTFFKNRFFQNLNFLEKAPTIWFHASSVGETNLSEPLVREILKKRKENILFSVFTDTGYENLKNKYKNEKRVQIIYFPLDNGKIIRNILMQIELKILVIIETEIWPNLIKLCKKKGKVIIVNGRISDKSFPKYQKLKLLLKNTFRNIDMVYTQTELDSERFVKLGILPEKVKNLGNLKFAINFPKYSEQEQQLLKEKIGYRDRKILVLGSTREEEEKLVLSNLKKDENLFIIVIPRHLNRINEIEEVLKELDYSYEKFSDIENKSFISEKKNILLVDKMGIQTKFYSIADAIFVGGTLVNIGGHSLLEALFYGKTPIYGKYLQNVKEIAKELEKRELGIEIESALYFDKALEKALSNKEKKIEIKALFKENSEVLEKTVAKIEILI